MGGVEVSGDGLGADFAGPGQVGAVDAVGVGVAGAAGIAAAGGSLDEAAGETESDLRDVGHDLVSALLGEFGGHGVVAYRG